MAHTETRNAIELRFISRVRPAHQVEFWCVGRTLPECIIVIRNWYKTTPQNRFDIPQQSERDGLLGYGLEPEPGAYQP